MALTFTPLDNLGMPLPGFELLGTDGQKYSSSTLISSTKPSVLMFICNHCPYVKAVEERLIQLGKDLRAQGVSVWAICSNDPEEYPDDNFEALKKRAAEKDYPFPYLHDPDQKVAKLLGAVCTPDFFVFDQSHRLAYRGRLDDSWKDPAKVTQRELYEAVQVLVKGQSLQGTQTPSMGCNIKWSLN